MTPRRPRDHGSVFVPTEPTSAGPALALAASLGVHLALALVVPSGFDFAALPEAQHVSFDLRMLPPPLEPSLPEPEPLPDPEPEPEPEHRVRRPREVVVRWERLDEPPEPPPAAEAPEDDSEPPGDPNATPEAAEPEGPAQATVASVEGGLEVGVPGGPGSDGAVHGRLRAGGASRDPGRESVPLVVDRRLRQAWMRRVRNSMGDAPYTLALRRTGLRGRVKVVFDVASDGRVLAVRVRESGGHELLDEAALDFARSIRRVEPPPTELHWAELPSRDRRMILPISYGI